MTKRTCKLVGRLTQECRGISPWLCSTQR